MDFLYSEVQVFQDRVECQQDIQRAMDDSDCISLSDFLLHRAEELGMEEEIEKIRSFLDRDEQRKAAELAISICVEDRNPDRLRLAIRNARELGISMYSSLFFSFILFPFFTHSDLPFFYLFLFSSNSSNIILSLIYCFFCMFP